MKRMSILALCALTVLTLSGAAFAAGTAQFDVKAAIQTTTQITTNIAMVINNNYTFGQPSVDFGTLALQTNGSFQPADGRFYAVDVGVNSNENWIVTHTVSSFTNGTANLDSHCTVTFVSQFGGASGTVTQLGKSSYGASNNFVAHKGDFVAGNYLRIYYGIASGGTADASDVTLIPSSQSAGNYQGTVTLSLTP
jgi:hypothetical protein